MNMRHRLNYIACFIIVGLLLFTLVPVYGALSPDIVSLDSFSTGILSPVKLALDETSGDYYVSDPRQKGVLHITSSGTPVALISTGSDVLSVAISRTGELLVSGSTTVSVYNQQGIRIKQFGTFGLANGIAVNNKTGDIFVVDSLNNSVQVFNPDYTPKQITSTGNSFGTSGIGDGQFRQPTGISYEKSADQIAVVDSRNGRIQFFTTTGQFVKKIGSLSVGYGPDTFMNPLFRSPQAITFEYNANQSLKRMYVLDTFQSTVYALDGNTGEFIRFIGSYGISGGKLIAPSDVLMDKNSRLLVANGTGTLKLFGVSDPNSIPFLQMDAIPSATNLASIAISGATSATSVTVNGISAPIGTDGHFSQSLNLAPGINTITVVASSAGGTVSKTLTITAQAPSGTPVSLTVDQVSSPTAQQQVVLAGTVTSGSSVMVNSVAATVSGTRWSAPITLALGTNSFVISATKTGMDTSSITVDIVHDITAPIMTAALPSNNATLRTPLFTVAGVVESTSATTVRVVINRQQFTTQAVEGIFSIPVTLSSGENIITVEAVDAKGAASTPVSTTVNFDPGAPLLTVGVPSGAISSAPTYRLSGSLPAGGSVTVNGAAASVNGTSWSYDATLAAGFNSFEITAKNQTGTSTSTAVATVGYAPGKPQISLYVPSQDSAIAASSLTFSGTAQPGAVVTATINNQTVPVTTTNSGTFSFALPTSASVLEYRVVTTVTDGSGASNTVIRTLLYEPNAPVVNIDPANPKKYSTTAPALVARDKNGPIATASLVNGVTTLDLGNRVFDLATLDVQAISAAGLSSRTGDLTGDKAVNIGDALKALRMSAGLDPAPSATQLLAGDVAPMVNFEARPDGKIGLDDVVVILNRLLGLIP